MTDRSEQATAVFVIDDDDLTQHQIRRLLAGSSMRLRQFASMIRFIDWLDYDRLASNTVIAAEISLRELGGLDLLNILKADRVPMRTVLMGSELSVSDAVDAMHAGANYILQKPFTDAAFSKAIDRAAQVSEPQRGALQPPQSTRRRFSSLSPRQRELLMHVFEGHTNREIARRLSISLKTVELHRAAMMQKMGAASLVELIRMTVECGELLNSGSQHECA